MAEPSLAASEPWRRGHGERSRALLASEMRQIKLAAAREGLSGRFCLHAAGRHVLFFFFHLVLLFSPPGQPAPHGKTPL